MGKLLGALQMFVAGINLISMLFNIGRGDALWSVANALILSLMLFLAYTNLREAKNE